jgi:hypothetical protein
LVALIGAAGLIVPPLINKIIDRQNPNRPPSLDRLKDATLQSYEKLGSSSQTFEENGPQNGPNDGARAEERDKAYADLLKEIGKLGDQFNAFGESSMSALQSLEGNSKAAFKEHLEFFKKTVLQPKTDAITSRWDLDRTEKFAWHNGPPNFEADRKLIRTQLSALKAAEQKDNQRRCDILNGLVDKM